MKRITFSLLVVGLLLLLPSSTKKTDVYKADIIIYGGTSAGVIAAVEAARSGKSVIMISPDTHLGGLSSRAKTGSKPNGSIQTRAF